MKIKSFENVVQGRIPIDRNTFVVAESRKDRNVGESLTQLVHSLFDDAQILIFSLIPNIMRRQITGPQDVVYILKIIWNRKESALVLEQFLLREIQQNYIFCQPNNII